MHQTVPHMHQFVTEMCTCAKNVCAKCCMVGYLSVQLWDLWDGPIAITCSDSLSCFQWLVLAKTAFNRFRISLGLYSLSGKTSYHQISWRLEFARLDVIKTVSLWNLTGISARCCRCAGRISERLEEPKPKSRGFETSRDLAVRRHTTDASVTSNHGPRTIFITRTISCP